MTHTYTPNENTHKVIHTNQKIAFSINLKGFGKIDYAETLISGRSAHTLLPLQVKKQRRLR